jgi:endoglucanase
MIDMHRFLKSTGPSTKLKMFSIVIPGLFLGTSLFGQLPTASEIAAQMIIGWNIGNSLEVPSGETGWGNPKVDQELIDAVSDAGFNFIRIPCAWESHADPSTLEIDRTWLGRVQQVVDYGYEDNLFVILNCHWDGGWLENHVTADAQEAVNEKQEAYWTQIAEYFKEYDEHLLFAGANEPNVDNAGQMAVLMSYHQTFINAVRATGENNASRTLIVQGPSTDIDKISQWWTAMPADVINDRLMAEVHYYTPWNFCGMTRDETWGTMFYFWGKDFHSTTNPSRNATWGEESAADALFQKMKTKFADQGIPVIMGEYGAVKRTSLTGADLDLHVASREYYYKYVTGSAIRHGLIPVYWDAGGTGNNTMTLFNRNDGSVFDRGALDALMEGAAAKTSVEDRRKSDSGAGGCRITARTTPGSSFTEIRLYLKSAGRANLTVFNILGQAVARFGERSFSPGLNSVKWNTGGLPAGTYLVHAEACGQTSTSKVLVLH